MTKQQTNEIRLRQHEHHAHQHAAYHGDLHAEINQARRLMRHLATHADDECAIEALRALPPAVLEHVPGALEMAGGGAKVH